jgi:hypothetical protein
VVCYSFIVEDLHLLLLAGLPAHLCKNFRAFSHEPVSFAFSGPETVQRQRNHEDPRFARSVAKFRGVLTRPRSNPPVRQAVRGCPVIAPNGPSRCKTGGPLSVETGLTNSVLTHSQQNLLSRHCGRQMEKRQLKSQPRSARSTSDFPTREATNG